MNQDRTEPYMSTYLHAKGRRLGLPIAGNFELTARCNFNCPMCYVHMTEEQVRQAGTELTAEQWIAIAREARDRGMVFVLLTGGEPFVRKDFFEIYGAMKKMGLMVSINSNGSMLNGEILEKLLEDPPVRINISLYGGCNETYQRMCGIPAFDKVLKNILRLKEKGVVVSLNLSITPYNYSDLKKIYEIVEEHELLVRASSYMYPAIRLDKGNQADDTRLSAKDSAKASVEWDYLRFSEEEFQRRAELMQRFVAVDQNDCYVEGEDVFEGVRCRAGSTSFWMTWDGQMRPCGMMPGPTAYPLEVGFDTAWDQIREATAQIRQPAKCTSCPKKEICGACAAVCVAETGEFNQVPQYMCERTDEILKITWKKYLQQNQIIN